MLIDSNTIKERRIIERFSLRIPTIIEILPPTKETTYNLISTNISARGAFFLTSNPIKKHTRVQLTLTIPSKILKKLTGTQSRVKVKGTVVRSDQTGFAICFDENYEITPKKTL